VQHPVFLQSVVLLKVLRQELVQPLRSVFL
jgi:hypothetical protein